MFQIHIIYAIIILLVFFFIVIIIIIWILMIKKIKIILNLLFTKKYNIFHGFNLIVTFIFLRMF